MTGRSRFIVTLVAGLFLATPFAVVDLSAQQELSREEIKWLDRLPREDSEAVSRSLGWQAPAFPESARWLGEPGPAMEDLRGKVVLVQTFATRGAGRSAATRLQRSIEPLANEQDFVAIAVHTPEGVDRAGELVPALKLEVPVLLDEEGTWCDSVGAFRRPITYLIDRQGNVRYASVSARKVEEAARKLLSEPFDQDTPSNEREEKPLDAGANVQFPDHDPGRPEHRPARQVRTALLHREDVEAYGGRCDQQGRRARLLGHMVRTLRRGDPPHERHPESLRQRSGLPRHLGRDQLRFPDAQERSQEERLRLRSRDRHQRTVEELLRVRGIPHVAVLSGDWVVRWQGHPNSLNKDVLDSIVNANRALVAASSDDGSAPAGALGGMADRQSPALTRAVNSPTRWDPDPSGRRI